jgi:hypothetical protein
MTILPGEVFRFQNKGPKDLYSSFSEITLTGKMEQYEEIRNNPLGDPVKEIKTRELPIVELKKHRLWKEPEESKTSLTIEFLNTSDFFVGAHYWVGDFSIMMPYMIPVRWFGVDPRHNLAEFKKVIKKHPEFHQIVGPGGGTIDLKVPGSDIEFVERTKEELREISEIRKKIEESKIQNIKLME